jgi:hypothetical protein
MPDTAPDAPVPAEPPPAAPPADPPRVARTQAEVIAGTVIDALVVLGILGNLALGRFRSEWMQGTALFVLASVAGVRLADLLNVAKGLPTRTGPGAIVLGALGTALARYTNNGG